MNTDLPILKSKWFELYFGLFGPQLTYHTNGYNDDNARIVISFIILKLYITCPWHDNRSTMYDLYGEYGFYFTNEPIPACVWRWGSTYKVFYMPWVRVTKELSLYNTNLEVDIVEDFKNIKFRDFHSTVIANPDKYLFKYQRHGEKYYYIEGNTSVPLWCNWINKLWFKKKVYFVTVFTNESRTEYFRFKTDTLICLPEQIDVQFAAREKDY